MTQEKLQDKIRGSLVGGAVGDAFGYPVEFIYSYEEIRTKYGDNGIAEYDLSKPWIDATSLKALFSDDTQMSLYTAEGLLEAENTGRPLIATICNSYLAWYGLQVGRKVKISYNSELAQIRELNQRRAPGNTCLDSLFTIYRCKEPMNASKGCGGVMRVAPIGLYGASHGWPLELTAKIAGEAAELTHLHPLSTYSSAALAALCRIFVAAECVTTSAVKDSVELVLKTLDLVYGADAPAMDDFKALIRKAVRLEEDLRQDWEIIENELGGGWVAEETLAIALFSVIRHIDDFKACMVCAVNHGGDSDSTGAVAGNIIGAIIGYDAIPEYFTDNIQLQDLLLSMSDRLAIKR